MTRPLAAATLSIVIGFAAPAGATTLGLDVSQWALCPNATEDAACSFADVDESFISQIFAQVDIVLNWLPATNAITNFAFVDTGGGEIDPYAALPDFMSALTFAGALDPGTAYMGYTPDMQGATAGLAYVGSLTNPAGIVQASGFSQRVTSYIFAHELGHILGATHDDAQESGNLMFPSFSEASITEDFVPTIAPDSATAMRASGLLSPVTLPVPVPVLPALPFLATALGALAVLRRRRDAVPAPDAGRPPQAA